MSYTKDVSVSFPTQTRGKAWIDGYAAEPAWTTTSRIVVVSRTRTGDRLPNWREIIAQGGNATTNLTAGWDTVDYRGTKRLWQSWRHNSYPTYTGRRWIEGDLEITNSAQIIYCTNPALSLSFVDNLARAAFYKKLHSEYRKMQGLVFLGELSETLHMLRRPALTLRQLAGDFLGTLRKRKRANPKKWTKDIAGAWLEQAFGWKPLLNDIQDAAKAWDSRTKTPDAHHVSAGAKKTYDRTSELVNYERVGVAWTPNSSGIYFLNKYTLLREHHIIRYRGAIRAQVDAPRWRDATLFGFQPEEFVPTAWELLPWSFLIDYFTNIGDILDASVTKTANVTYVNKSALRRTEKYRAFEMVADGSLGTFGAGWYLSAAETGGRRLHFNTRKEFWRTKDVGVPPLPTLQFNFSLSDGQLGNCAALLAQANSLHPQDKPRRWHR